MALVELPVCFDDDFGCDLADIAARTTLTVAEVIALLTEGAYRVERLGFLPGFPYLNGLPDELHLPRRAKPRKRVPAGSVAIANGQLGIYPCDSPGGWHLVGRTATVLFDPERRPPALLRPDDQVRLVAIARSAMHHRPPGAEARSVADAGDAARLKIERPGIRTTVEDAGRFGWEADGVAPGGAADRRAMQLANALVGNDMHAAVLEAAVQGPAFTCAVPLLIAVTGAAMPFTVDGRSLPCHRPVAVPAGARVACGSIERGMRAVIAVGGGIEVPSVLGSRSTHLHGCFGGHAGRTLRKGDQLPLGAPTAGQAQLLRAVLASGGVERASLSLDLLGAPLREAPPYLLRCTAGEAFGSLASEVRSALAGAGLACSLSSAADRMGARFTEPLPGPPLVGAGQRRSAPVQRGTVQLPPDNVPILLGADHQVTGGYPVLGQVIDADQSTLAQLRPGDALRLQVVSQDQADLLDAHAATAHAMALAALQWRYRGPER